MNCNSCNMYCNSCNKYCSVLCAILCTILLAYCTYCTYCTSYNLLYIYANIVQYCPILYAKLHAALVWFADGSYFDSAAARAAGMASSPACYTGPGPMVHETAGSSMHSGCPSLRLGRRRAAEPLPGMMMAMPVSRRRPGRQTKLSTCNGYGPGLAQGPTMPPLRRWAPPQCRGRGGQSAHKLRHGCSGRAQACITDWHDDVTASVTDHLVTESHGPPAAFTVSTPGPLMSAAGSDSEAA